MTLVELKSKVYIDPTVLGVMQLTHKLCPAAAF